MSNPTPDTAELTRLAAVFNNRAFGVIIDDDNLIERGDDKLDFDFSVKRLTAFKLAKTPEGRDSTDYTRLIMEIANTLAEVLNQHASDAEVIRAMPTSLQKPELAPAFAAQGAPQLAKLVARFH